MTILDALRDVPLTKRVLAEKLGVSPREVEAEVQAARLRGVPIVSDSDGYRLGTAEEVEACSVALRRRAIHQLLTARALRRTARRLEGIVQRSLWAA